MNENTLNKTHLRTIQYWFEDGIVEISFGVVLLFLAASYYVDVLMPDSLLANLFYGMFILILIGGWFVVNKAVTWLKERITYPRTGYVSYKREKDSGKPRRLVIAMLVGALVSAGTVILVVQRPMGLNVMPAAGGLMLGLVLGLIGFRTALPRFYIPAAFGLLFGFGLTFSGIGNMLGLAILYSATALLLIVTGIIVLNRYLRANPAPAEAGDDQ